MPIEARSSRELLRIHTDVPVEFDIERFRYPGANQPDCFELFSALGFRSLVMEFAPTADTIDKDYQTIVDSAGLATLVSELRAATRFGLRVMPDGDIAVRAGIAGLVFATAPRRARYVPLQPAAGTAAARADGPGERSARRRTGGGCASGRLAAAARRGSEAAQARPRRSDD